jgi:acetylornithine/succinyldiaminopimelate/putrescine aminotransferase
VQRIGAGADFQAWDEISCLLYEPIPASAGFVPLPLPWLRALSQSARSAGVVVIANEIQTGFYRFGKLSLAVDEYLRPDFYLFGNSMTNGVYPLFAMVYSEAVEPIRAPGETTWKPTFQTASIGFQAAEAVARYIDSNSIENQVAEVNFHLSRAGERLASNSRLTAFHLAGPTLSLEVRDGRAERLLHTCEKRGILIGAIGRRVVIAPPITIPPDHLTHALKVVEQAANTP